MPPPPNRVFTAFSFVGFVLCVIPFYWHLEAWNTGTCLYMIWVGLGCLLQCINSIVWNKNMINRVPVYCDISTRIQVALNVAIPACSLCINRRLYKIATMKTVMSTSSEKRRAVICDLIIGIGIPFLQVIAQYVVSANRYNIFEDFGPDASMVNTPLTYVLVFAWPVAIGTVSLFYCVTNICIFYQRECQFKQLMSSTPGLNRNRYIRLMVISAAEILGTIPLGTFYIIHNSKLGVTPWRGWTWTHEDYSAVYQIPVSIWKNNPSSVLVLEVYRWSLVLCAFIFFAFFGFANEARQNYRRLYTSIAGRIGHSTFTLLRSRNNAISTVPYVKNNSGLTFCVVTMSEDKSSSDISFSGQSLMQSVSVDDNLNPDFRDRYSPSNTVISSSVESFHEAENATKKDPSALLAGTMPTVPSATVPPHLPGMTKSILRAYSSFDAV